MTYTPLSRSIAGKVALVTGAASGMGRATARLFAEEGAMVAASDINADGLASLVEEIEGAGGRAMAFPLDVADAGACARTVEGVVAAFGGLDILINNAGLSTFCPFEDAGFPGAWARSLDVMLTGQMVLARAALPHLKRSGAGRIVNIASTEGLGATRYNTAYAAAKHGAIGLTHGLAVELGAEGVTVNCICPGPIHTGITAGIPDEHKEIYAKRRVPLRRYGIPEEVAHITLSCVLPAASFLNGAVIPVDGGMIIKNG